LLETTVEFEVYIGGNRDANVSMCQGTMKRELMQVRIYLN